MKLLLPILALGVAMTGYAKNDVFTTPNTGTIYTFADLAKIEGTGVTQIDENTFSVVNDLDVLANDGITLTDGMTLELGKDVLIRLYGSKSSLTPDSATVKAIEGQAPKGIHFTEIDKPVVIKHVRFEQAGMKIGDGYGVTVENCTFYEHNEKSGHAAIDFVANSINNVVRNCYFIRTVTAAISSGSNVAAGVTIEDNVMEDCSTRNGNYPVINQTPAADNGPVIIRRNKILGGKRTRPGAISMSNMLSMIGDHKIFIEDNYMDNSRYGINILGNYMDIRVKGNQVIDCHYETNAMNGGSGITVNSTSDEHPTRVYIEGNRFEGCLWGATIIGKALVNMGHVTDVTGDDYNPGGNVFKNNGNCGTAPAGAETAFDPSIPYDLYNNTAMTLYAQGNTWGCEQQTAAEIEKYIFHSADDPTKGEVIFLPVAGDTSAIESIEGNADAVPVMYVQPSGIVSATPVKGINIVKMSDGTVRKVIVR